MPLGDVVGDVVGGWAASPLLTRRKVPAGGGRRAGDRGGEVRRIRVDDVGPGACPRCWCAGTRSVRPHRRAPPHSRTVWQRHALIVPPRSPGRISRYWGGLQGEVSMGSGQIDSATRRRGGHSHTWLTMTSNARHSATTCAATATRRTCTAGAASATASATTPIPTLHTKNDAGSPGVHASSYTTHREARSEDRVSTPVTSTAGGKRRAAVAAQNRVRSGTTGVFWEIGAGCGALIPPPNPGRPMPRSRSGTQNRGAPYSDTQPCHGTFARAIARTGATACHVAPSTSRASTGPVAFRMTTSASHRQGPGTAPGPLHGREGRSLPGRQGEPHRLHAVGRRLEGHEAPAGAAVGEGAMRAFN